MSTASEQIEPLSGEALRPHALPDGLPLVDGDNVLVLPRPQRSRQRLDTHTPALERFRWAIGLYLATRGLLLLVAFVNGAIRNHSFIHQLAHWDGLWYGQLATHGYPHLVTHAQTTLGFFPLYSMAMWALAHLFSWTGTLSSIRIAGIVISGIGGLVATVLVQQLATGWWGEKLGRRATVLFCLFPGSVVFSMVYAEGVMLPLAAGCLLALERRRWLLAGVLAGAATAVEPEALVLIPVCALSALLELRRCGFRLRDARRSLFAPLLSVTGVCAFACFLWAWTGTPFANLQAQRYGWGERSDPFALVHLASSLFGQISLAHFNQPTINLNLVVGLIGGVFLIVCLGLLFRARRTVSPEALAWTLGVGVLALTSEFIPPNPRLLITAFPAVIVLARYVRGRAWPLLAWSMGLSLAVLSALTFVGPTLRP